MSIENPGGQPEPQLQEAVRQYYELGYGVTKSELNVGRYNVAVDLTRHETDSRVLVAAHNSELSESLIRGVLGGSAVFSMKPEAKNPAVYDVPRGSRPIESAIDRKFYVGTDLERLIIRRNNLLRMLSFLDDNAFGMSEQTIVLRFVNKFVIPETPDMALVPPFTPPKNTNIKLGNLASHVASGKQLWHDIRARRIV